MQRASSVLTLLAAALLFAWCGRQQPNLVAERAGRKLTPDSAMAGTPPVVAFTTVVLGGFRGVLADLLWLRVSGLQREGRYFELVQLSDWITMLEPRAAGTWVFHAWNMAYNVSSLMPDPAERWQWIQNGIQLLRDRGLRYNPHDARLYFELGWLFQHKFGTHTDRAWLYYQQRLAAETDAVMPGGRLAEAAPGPDEPATRELQAKLGFDPATIRAIDARLGPLDWRLPESQALYWAYLGLQRGGNAHDFLCERMLYQCLVGSFFQGRLTLDAAAGVYTRAPRPELLDRVLAVFAEARAGPNARRVHEAYLRFLREAEPVLTQAGQAPAAARVQALLSQEQAPGG